VSEARTRGYDFRHLTLGGYRNINQLYPQVDRLHCCETLFGDPQAEVLLLAQDAAHVSRFEAAMAKDPAQNPFRHDPHLPTNAYLFEYLRKYFDVGRSTEDPNNRGCNIYYANAIWLLKEGDSAQAAVKQEGKALEVSLPVLTATVNQLVRLRVVIALGSVAYRAIRLLDPRLPRWADVRCRGLHPASLLGKQVMVGTTFHPGGRGRNNRVRHEKSMGRSESPDALFERDFDGFFSEAFPRS
jgi:hypothetical protein